MRYRIRSLVTRLRRSKRLTAALAGVVGAALAAAVLPLVLPVGAALLMLTVLFAAIVAFGVRQAFALSALHHDLAQSTLVYGAPSAPRTPSDSAERRAEQIARVRTAIESGFPETALASAKALAADARIPAERRLELLGSVLDWYVEDDARRGEPVPHSQFDIVLISHLGLPGGNTSASAADIQAFRDLGLTVGLVHHPVFAWRPGASVSERIERLVDGVQVRIIGARETVECDLAVVRLPTILSKPLEVRPTIRARETVVIANQTPYRYYGHDGPREAAWDLPTVDANVARWIGEATWYTGGPAVHRILTEHHRAEVAAMKFAPEPWNECIDVAQWRFDERREKDGRIRIGRHSRDHHVKWPEDPERLRRSYPDADGIEVHILGGADVPRRLLGRLPSNWSVRSFGAITPQEFLRSIDVFVYFIASDGAEAFGRAPLEAMAAGVPVIMDPVFAPTFGDAALYCAPEDVEATARRLMDDTEWYASRQSAAWAFVEAQCSPRALADRLARHGVAAEHAAT